MLDLTTRNSLKGLREDDCGGEGDDDGGGMNESSLNNLLISAILRSHSNH